MAYDLFPMDRYYGYSVIPNYNEAVTTRGCEGACHFITSGGWLIRAIHVISAHTAPGAVKVADEMEVLNKQYGVVAHIYGR